MQVSTRSACWHVCVRVRSGHSNTSGGADGETEGCREGECRYYLDISPSPWCPVHKLRWCFVISAVVTLLVTYYYLLLVTATDM